MYKKRGGRWMDGFLGRRNGSCGDDRHTGQSPPESARVYPADWVVIPSDDISNGWRRSRFQRGGGVREKRWEY